MKKTFHFPKKEKLCILSLGAESAGRFVVYDNGKISISENFGDLIEENNFKTFKKAVLSQIKTKKPNVILTDLHPLYNSTILGHKLSEKLKVSHIKVQHHIAHIFSAVGNYIFESKAVDKNNLLPDTFYGIASDGTGYGFDGNIWGGEVFKIESQKSKVESYNSKSQINNSQNLIIQRIGSLEEQTMIGGDLAVKEPARMLISILSKFLSKEKVYINVKKFYTKNEFELLFSQLQQNFNCQKTTSTGRILDTVSVLFGFAKNERKSKHEATKFLEENSTIPYKDYKLQIKNPACKLRSYELQKVLDTTYLFKHLLKNIDKDKRRLAATAQEYIAKGFYEIVKEAKLPARSLISTSKNIPNTYFAGGMANNKNISSYLENKGVYTSKKIPRGDEGIAFGQIVFYILN